MLIFFMQENLLLSEIPHSIKAILAYLESIVYVYIFYYKLFIYCINIYVIAPGKQIVLLQMRIPQFSIAY